MNAYSSAGSPGPGPTVTLRVSSAAISGQTLANRITSRRRAAGVSSFLFATKLILFTASARAGIVAVRRRTEFRLFRTRGVRMRPRRPRSASKVGPGEPLQVELQHKGPEGIGVLDIHAGITSGHDKVLGWSPIAAVLRVGHDFIIQVLHSLSQRASIAEKGLVLQKTEERAQHGRDRLEEGNFGRHLPGKNLRAALLNRIAVPFIGRQVEILVSVFSEKFRDSARLALVRIAQSRKRSAFCKDLMPVIDRREDGP